MKGFKSILIPSAAAVAVGLFSLNAFANGGAFVPPPLPPATTPPPATGWFITGGGLLAKPTDSDLSNTILGFVDTFFDGGSKNTIDKLHPKYQWGGYGELGYRFAGPYDVVLAFHGIFGKTSKHISIDPNNLNAFIFTPVFPPTVAPNPTKVATKVDSELKTDYFTIDAVGRRHINMGHHVNLILYGGARFMYLHEEFEINAWNARAKPDTSETNSEASLCYKTHFYGLGPMIGAKATAKVVGGLGVFSDVHGALLFGHTDNEYTHTVVDLTKDGTSTATVTDSGDKSTRLVPNVGGKVGIDFTFPVDSMFVRIEGGYMGDFYYHTIDNRQLKRDFPGFFPHIFTGENRTKFSNFTVAGPFAGITIGIDGNSDSGGGYSY